MTHDNQSAFLLSDHYSHDGMPLTEGSPGMNLLDYFAAAALQGLLALPDDGTLRTEEGHAAHYSRLSYVYGEAMLAERARRKEIGA